jgi:hypothetical protein
MSLIKLRMGKARKVPGYVQLSKKRTMRQKKRSKIGFLRRRSLDTCEFYQAEKFILSRRYVEQLSQQSAWY